MSQPTIVDMRSRPALLHPFYGAAPEGPESEAVAWLNSRTGSADPRHFVRSRTLEGYVAEVAAAGISTAVVVGRSTPGVHIPNELIAGMVAEHPDRLVGIGGVDPRSSNAVAESHRAVRELGLRAINIEPGFLDPPVKVDDPVLFPVYQACRELGVPVCLMSGPTAADLDDVRPVAVARVAREFPDLPIVCYHGFYPYVAEMVAVAFKHPNVHVVADMYTFAPGGELYLEAANGFLRDQFLFGTAYPFRAMGQTVADFCAKAMAPEVLDKVLHANAERLLRLSVAGIPAQASDAALVATGS